MITKKDYLRDKYDISDLVAVMNILRAPDGCPWDSAQTHKSIRNDLLEEAYETADAIDLEDSDALREELGDLLLQVIFHSSISEADGEFDFSDVVDGLVRKLIFRHTHVFGDKKADNTAEALDNWNAAKREEKNQETFTDTLKSVPKAFPAVMRSQKVQKRAAKSGLDFADIGAAMDKLYEETDELKAAVTEGNTDNIEEEAGDLLFSAVNVARLLHINGEEALTRSTEKFIARFSAVEDAALKSGKDMTELTPSELDELWNEVKKNSVH